MQCGGQVGEDLPLENRPQEPLLDDYEHEQEESECDVVDTTRPCTDEPVIDTTNKDTISAKKPYLETQNALNSRQATDEDRNNRRLPQDTTNPSKPKRPLSSTGDVSTSENLLTLNEKGRQRSHSAGKETELKNHVVQDKNLRRKNDELSKFAKRKSNPSNSEKVDYVKTQKMEIKTKTTSEVTQSETVNCVKPETKHHGKAERPVSKKEQSEKGTSSTGSPRKGSHSKQQSVTNAAHRGNKSTSSTDATHGGTATKTSSDTAQVPVKRSKDGGTTADHTHNSSTATDSSRTSTKGTSAGGHSPGSNKTAPNEGDREHKPGK